MNLKQFLLLSTGISVLDEKRDCCLRVFQTNRSSHFDTFLVPMKYLSHNKDVWLLFGKLSEAIQSS